MVARNLGIKINVMLSSARFEKQPTTVRMLCFEKKKFGKIYGLYGDVAYKSTHHSW